MASRTFLKLAIVMAAVGCAAQTITVDVTPSHVRKTIIPNQAQASIAYPKKPSIPPLPNR